MNQTAEMHVVSCSPYLWQYS